MLNWAKRYPDVFQILPIEEKEIENLHRKFIANVIYSVAGEDFKTFVEKKMNERTKKLAESRNMNIKMDPEIYKIYKENNNISGKYPSIRMLMILI